MLSSHYVLSFTESAPRTIQSISHNDRLSFDLSVCPLLRFQGPHGLKTSGRRAYRLNCKTNNPLMLGLDDFLKFLDFIFIFGFFRFFGFFFQSY